ncbi:carboxypeptidase regulatory-like domain-containing protein [candidate division KSB1 bacterium]|nr:carboxypeptidase regulatory-like domain-containing protein [candidate division KSB1 bacterium]
MLFCTKGRYRLAFAVLVALFFAGCDDAPHDNPLDPLSPKYENRGSLLVRAQSFYPPRSPLANVTLFLAPGNYLLTTNTEGTAVFSDLAPQPYVLVASKNGYVGDTVEVEVRAHQTAQYAFQLNAIPQITNVAIYSERISRWFPVNLDSYNLVVTAHVQDADGAQDLTRVQLLSKTHGALQDMTFRPEIGRFELIIKEADLPGKSIFDFIGESLQIAAHDREAALTLSEPFALARVIEATPIAESPAGLHRTSVRPRFAWHSTTVPYTYSFRIDISQFEPEQQFATLFESVGDIHPDSTTYLTSHDLPGGTYYWTVSIVDRYGNISRSKEATFEVR